MGQSQSLTEEGSGWRVFKVSPGSPAEEASLEVFFDFVLEISGVAPAEDQATFARLIQDGENIRTKLVVYNIRTHTSRDVYVVPRKWGGAGLLGAVVRFDSLENTDSQGLRVLEVFDGSPAAEAGLVPFKDYLLGTTEVMFRNMEELIEILCVSQGREIRINVYNSDSEGIREVTLVPRTGWGGEGSIGADIRTGLLHRIPAPRRQFGFVHPVQNVVPPASVPDAALPVAALPQGAAAVAAAAVAAASAVTAAHSSRPPQDPEDTAVAAFAAGEPGALHHGAAYPESLFPGAVAHSPEPSSSSRAIAAPESQVPPAEEDDTPETTPQRSEAVGVGPIASARAPELCGPSSVEGVEQGLQSLASFIGDGPASSSATRPEGAPPSRAAPAQPFQAAHVTTNGVNHIRQSSRQAPEKAPDPWAPPVPGIIYEIFPPEACGPPVV